MADLSASNPSPGREDAQSPADRPLRFAALRQRNFRLLWAGQFISVSGSQMQSAAILWQVYALTGDPLALGAVGLCRLAPIFLFGILSGMVADSVDRRRLMIFTQSGLAAVALGFAALSFSGAMTIGWLYGLMILSASFGVFDAPARQSLIPALVPRRDLTNAFSLNSTMMQAAGVIGPAAAGLMIGQAGLGWVYLINAVSFLAVIYSLLAMKGVGGGTRERSPISLGAAKEGMRFVFAHPIIRSTMLLDFIATFFASATALLPIFAADILRVGAEGYGVLFSAAAIGALGMGIFLSLIHRIPRQGPVLLIAVGLFGLATAVFGISRSFWITFAALAVTGATDMISMVVRNTARQLQTPDSLRGRMVSLNMLFFMGGPQLGEFEAGAVADALGAPASVVLGGLGAIAATAWIAATTPELRQYNG
ncbi:MAG: MFS transporter [Anaerolineales bacterium]|nr:MFS transporter [Anaerolineales bacterium]